VFSIWTYLIIGWIGWDDYIAIAIGCVGSTIHITSLINSTSSTWMLSITWSKLGSGCSSMLPYVIVV